MPMLDFCTGLGPESVQTIKESVRLPRGVFLISGNSYHFMGYELMPEDKWHGWMEELSKYGSLESVIDTQYLDYSIKRGYAALRVFGYPGTNKEVSPKVIGYESRSS